MGQICPLEKLDVIDAMVGGTMELVGLGELGLVGRSNFGSHEIHRNPRLGMNIHNFPAILG